MSSHAVGARDDAIEALDHLVAAALQGATEIGERSRRAGATARDRAASAILALRGQRRPPPWPWLVGGLGVGLLVGAVAGAALARTGRLYDGWLPYPPNPADYETGLAQVRRAARGAGRAAQAVTPALFATLLITNDLEAGRRALSDYTQASYRMPLEVVETIQVLIAGPLEFVTAELDRYIAAGARHIVCRIGALGLKSQLDQLELVRMLYR